MALIDGAATPAVSGTLATPPSGRAPLIPAHTVATRASAGTTIARLFQPARRRPRTDRGSKLACSSIDASVDLGCKTEVSRREGYPDARVLPVDAIVVTD
jgi:hypothetical protein